MAALSVQMKSNFMICWVLRMMMKYKLKLSRLGLDCGYSTRPLIPHSCLPAQKCSGHALNKCVFCWIISSARGLENEFFMNTQRTFKLDATRIHVKKTKLHTLPYLNKKTLYIPPPTYPENIVVVIDISASYLLEKEKSLTHFHYIEHTIEKVSEREQRVMKLKPTCYTCCT